MTEELDELLTATIYKEIASNALYTAAQTKTTDAGARALLKELAGQELKHSNMLKKLRDEKLYEKGWRRDNVPDLKISEFLMGSDISQDAGLQDVLIFAIKREQSSVELYSRMMSAISSNGAKQLCMSLANEELAHKLKLELMYDEMFYQEN